MLLRIRFILNEPRNPKNIGASARGMANFGFRDLAVVNPYSVAWRETRSAVKAADVVKKAKKFKSLKEAIRSAHVVIGTSAGSRRSGNIQWIGLDKLRALVRESSKSRKSVALVFGSERSGLSNDDLAFCHYVLKIPTAEACPSMNLSQAVAVVACAIRPDALKATAPEIPVQTRSASVEQMEHLVDRAVKAYTSAGLLNAWDPARSKARVRKTLYSWNLGEVDVKVLHGLFGWVIKKAKT